MRRARALEQQGLFDTRVWGRLFYEYRQQELTRTIRDQEQERRTDMSDALAAARRDYDRLQELSRLLGIVRAAAPGAPQVNAIGAISPDVASQIKALDVLIAGQANASVRTQLRTIRDEFIDRTIADASEGAARAIDGFQEGEDRLRRLGTTPERRGDLQRRLRVQRFAPPSCGAELHALYRTAASTATTTRASATRKTTAGRGSTICIRSAPG